MATTGSNSEDNLAVAEQHAALGLTHSTATLHSTHPDAQWFPRAGLGFFVHWGIASVHGDLDLSWAMIANTNYDAAANGRNKLPPAKYWLLADSFQPDRYDPDRWLKAASAAGMQYAVFTTMHHDGYTLWPTRFGDFGVQSHLGGRDLVRPFVEACRKYGLRVGLYYSPPDWHFDREYKSFNYRTDGSTATGRPKFDVHHQPCDLPAEPDSHSARRREMFHGRIEELLTWYGKIDLLWLDGGVHDNELRDLARTLQPHIVMNSRSCDGDFDCTECSLPEERFSGWFETPHCWQHSDLLSPHGAGVDFWGYLADEKYKPTEWMLECLVRLRTWGGNLLINVGPRPNGELPDVVYDRLEETARWMERNQRAVIGSEPGPYPELCNVPVTRNGNTWFLFAMPGESGDMELRKVSEPVSVTLLRTGERLSYTHVEGTLKVQIPNELRSQYPDVAAVEL